MKWFQHQTDSYTNLKLQRAKKVFGLEGIGFWWLCCELVGQQGNSYKIDANRCWKEWLMMQSDLPVERIDAILEKFAEFGLIEKNLYLKGHLAIPQMNQYSDDYTKKVRREYGESTDRVRVDKIRLDKNRLDDINTPFDVFWKEYPNKTGKLYALKCFQKINPPKELFSKIIFAIQKQKEGRKWKEENGKYIPHPSTWLNQGRWDDEIEETKSKIIKITDLK